MHRNHVYLSFFLLIFTAVIILIIVWQLQKNPWDSINNFNDCVKGGYPVMQSYPPQCTIPNGKFFIQQVVPGR